MTFLILLSVHAYICRFVYGMFGFPGGMVDDGETPEASVGRSTATALSPVPPTLINSMVYWDSIATSKV